MKTRDCVLLIVAVCKEMFVDYEHFFFFKGQFKIILLSLVHGKRKLLHFKKINLELKSTIFQTHVLELKKVNHSVTKSVTRKVMLKQVTRAGCVGQIG